MSAIHGVLAAIIAAWCSIAHADNTTAPPTPAPVTSPPPVYWSIDVGDLTRIVVELPRLPPSRITVSFNSVEGRHEDLVWTTDPHEHLTKAVHLPAGCWRVSFAAEPVRAASQPTTNLTWRVGAAALIPDSSATSITPCSKVTSLAWSFLDEDGTALRLDLTKKNLAKLADVANSLVEAGGGITGFNKHELSTGARDAERTVAVAADAATSDFLSTLVLTRVQTMAAHKLREEGRELFCNKLKTGENPVFPRTCRAFDSIDIRDLAVSGRALLYSIRSDIESYVSDVGIKLLETEFSSLNVDTTVLPHLLGVARRLFSVARLDSLAPDAFSEALLTEFSRVDWVELLPQNKAYACAVEVALASAASCRGSGCGLSDLVEMVDHPDRMFDLGNCKDVYTPDTIRLIELATLGIPAARRGLNDTEVIASMTDVGLSVVEGLACAPGPQCKKLDEAVARLKGVLRGLATHDVQLMLSESMTFIAAATVTDRRFATRLLGALAILLDDAQRTGGQITASARAKALDALMAEPFNRGLRGGEWLWSLGVAGRAVSGSRCVHRSEIGCDWEFGLSIPVGVSVDRLFKYSDYGVHFEVTVANAGNYLTKGGDVDYWDIISPGVSVAFFRGRNLPVTLGVEATYIPRWKEDDSFRFLVGLGAYVPVLDLN